MRGWYFILLTTHKTGCYKSYKVVLRLLSHRRDISFVAATWIQPDSVISTHPVNTMEAMDELFMMIALDKVSCSMINL